MVFMMRHILLWATILCVLCLQTTPAVLADGPDYAVPGRLALPWACGEAYRVTWGPAEHWANWKATGVAYNFALPVGTPVYAPAAGRAYFLEDERYLPTNFGHYVELVVGDDWAVRMAHLRDAQSGERDVAAGELLGHSGSSGVTEAHLHLEILVRDGADWVRPDLARLTSLFGMPRSAFAIGAYVLNAGCLPSLSLDGGMPPADLALGERGEIVIPLRNEGLQDAQVERVEATLRAPSGRTTRAEWTGSWTIGGQATGEVRVDITPDEAGLWEIADVVCHTAQGPQALATPISVNAVGPPLQVLGLRPKGEAHSDRPLTLMLGLANTLDQPVVTDGLWIEGLDSHGNPWEARQAASVRMEPAATATFSLTCPRLPTATGEWTATHLSWEREGTRRKLSDLDARFTVSGPELVVDQIVGYRSADGLEILAVVRNVGGEPIAPDTIEAWGWRPDDGGHFSLSQSQPAPLAPGAASLVRLEADASGIAGSADLVEIGYWLDGRYVRMQHLADAVQVLSPRDRAE